MRRAAKSLIGVVAIVSLVGCLINISDVDRDLRFEVAKSFSFQPDAAALERLRLEGINGTVLIVGDANTGVAAITGEIRVRSDSRDDASDFLERVSVEVTEVGDELTVRTRQPNGTDGREVNVDYDVTIPADLDVTVEHVNGPVDLESVDGVIRVENINGSVGLLGSVGDVDVTLINGDIVADVAPAAGGLLDLFVTNGTIALDIPTSVSAMLEADVVNGTITLSGLTLLDATTSTRSVRGRLTDGDGLIDLDVTNGVITVRGR